MRTKAQAICWLLGLGFALVLGGAMLSIGLIHNPQQAFQTIAGDFRWRYAALLFGAWFIVGVVLSAVVCVAFGAGAAVVRWVRRNRGVGSAD